MAKRYKLPDALGGGECIVENERQWHGPDRYVRATVGEGDEAITVDLLRALLTEVEDPLPEEPPNLATVLVGQWAYQRDSAGAADRQKPWHGDDGWFSWCELHEDLTGPVIRLVPDPCAEPVELPWQATDRYSGQHVQVRVSEADWREPGDEGPSRPSAAWVAAGRERQGSHITAELARAMARALWTAADQAEAHHG